MGGYKARLLSLAVATMRKYSRRDNGYRRSGDGYHTGNLIRVVGVRDCVQKLKTNTNHTRLLPNAMDRGGRLHLFRTFVFRICI